MITREQLELAALAAGIAFNYHSAAVDNGLWVSDRSIGILYWRPHTNIADAARLAVKLQFAVVIDKYKCSASSSDELVVEVRNDGTQADAERAYCEAVTLCAAAVGEMMRGDA